jgi:hypothetical protein
MGVIAALTRGVPAAVSIQRGNAHLCAKLRQGIGLCGSFRRYHIPDPAARKVCPWRGIPFRVGCLQRLYFHTRDFEPGVMTRRKSEL